MPAARSSLTASARAVATPGASVLSVLGVCTGSAAENGTFQSCAVAVVAVSRRQNRSKSSAPRLPVLMEWSHAFSTPHASLTSTAPPSLPVAVPPANEAHARAVSSAMRSPEVARFANCCACRSRTVSFPFAAIADTSAFAPRARVDSGEPIEPKTRSYPVSGRSVSASQALSLEFTKIGSVEKGAGQPGCY